MITKCKSKWTQLDIKYVAKTESNSKPNILIFDYRAVALVFAVRIFVPG